MRFVEFCRARGGQNHLAEHADGSTIVYNGAIPYAQLEGYQLEGYPPPALCFDLRTALHMLPTDLWIAVLQGILRATGRHGLPAGTILASVRGMLDTFGDRREDGPAVLELCSARMEICEAFQRNGALLLDGEYNPIDVALCDPYETAFDDYVGQRPGLIIRCRYFPYANRDLRRLREASDSALDAADRALQKKGYVRPDLIPAGEALSEAWRPPAMRNILQACVGRESELYELSVYAMLIEMQLEHAGF